jgi:hypothetical protein
LVLTLLSDSFTSCIGSDIECQYALLSFGIPAKEIMSVNANGVLQRKVHWNFLKARKTQEGLIRRGIMNHQTVIVVPARMDVQFGRGQMIQHHVGNMRLAHLIEENGEIYKATINRIRKRAIANSILDMIKLEGGRFLRQDKDGLWEVVHGKEASDKVTHGFRNRNRKPARKIKSAIGKVVNKRLADNSSTMSEVVPASSASTRIGSKDLIVSKRSKFGDDEKRGADESPSVVSLVQSSLTSQEHSATQYFWKTEETPLLGIAAEAALEDMPFNFEDLPNTLDELMMEDLREVDDHNMLATPDVFDVPA